MNLPSDSPRLPKWIFFVGYASLISVAWLIHDGADHPWAGWPLLSIVALVALAAVLIAVPFIADYAHSQDEALDNRQRALQTLAATVAASSEQIAIATAGLQKLTGIAQENAAQSERLAQQIQDRIAELRTSVAAVKKEDSDAAAVLDDAAKKIAKVASDLESKAARPAEESDAVARIEAAAKRISKAVAELEAKAARPAEIARVAHPEAAAVEQPPVLLSKMVEIKPAVSTPSHSPFEVPLPFAAPAPEAPPAVPMAAAVEPVPVPAPAEPAAAEVPVAAPAPRKRSPRKPAAPVQPAADLVLESPAPEAPAPAPEFAEPAVSSDGATRLIVTAYIGIGNRLTIRGEGPGLSWEKGLPLSFVSIGKWRWETSDATSTVRFKLYKNDEVECTALGERSVEPGAQQELSASF